MKLIPLSMWAERRYGKVPSSRTLRRWRTEQCVEPLPRKVGRSWLVLENAKYWEPGTKPRLVERVWPNEPDEDDPDEGFLPEASWVTQIRKDREHLVLPLDQLRALDLVGKETRWSGVYFLWRNSRLMYVGESKNIYARIREHKWEGKRFTHATYLYFQRQSKMEIEARYVMHYRPPLNRTRHG